MGTRMAPSYANLFMSRFGAEHINMNNQFEGKMVYNKRLIDDLFFLWRGTQEEALMFTEFLNKNNCHFTFTPIIQKYEIEFLDLVIAHQGEKFTTIDITPAVISILPVDTTKNGRETYPMDNSDESEKIAQKTSNLKNRLKPFANFSRRKVTKSTLSTMLMIEPGF